jgi:hypothetical protein
MVGPGYADLVSDASITPPGPLPATPSEPRARLVLVLALLLAAWTQRFALMAFFSSPDDLVHLQQARGLLPVQASPFRFLSQVLYFRLMLATVGLRPWIFHGVSLAVHVINVALVYRFARTLGAGRMTATLGAGWFGSYRLFYPLLASAVGMNDELALLLALVAMDTAVRGGRAATVGSVLAFVLAVLCKESVVALPLVVVLAGAGGSKRAARPWVLAALGVVFGILKMLRPEQGLAPYALGGIRDGFTNLMTYTAWAVNVTRPLPDLVSSQDTSAWRVGLPVFAVLLLGLWKLESRRSVIGLGLVWWIAGLLPVLPLRYQTYRHYLYPALPGLALAVAATLDGLLAELGRSRAMARAGLGAGLVSVLLIGYAFLSNILTIQRLDARVPGTTMALDPAIRRSQLAREALFSMARSLPVGTHSWVVLLEPADAIHVYGARTGRVYEKLPAGASPYDLLRESLENGGAVRLYFPEVDSVTFARQWQDSFRSGELFVPDPAGGLRAFGRGDSAAIGAGHWMLAQGWSADGERLLSAAAAAGSGASSTTIPTAR